MYKLPYYYDGVPEIDILRNKLDMTVEQIVEVINRIEQEQTVISAENKGLDIWSETLTSSKSKKDILTKLRGAKTITILNLALMIKDLLGESSKVEIIEENEKYLVHVGIHNDAVNIEDVKTKLKNDLRLIIPSHIDLDVYFNALTWFRFDNLDKTWEQWDGLNLSWEQLEKYNEGI